MHNIKYILMIFILISCGYNSKKDFSYKAKKGEATIMLKTKNYNRIFIAKNNHHTVFKKDIEISQSKWCNTNSTECFYTNPYNATYGGLVGGMILLITIGGLTSINFFNGNNDYNYYSSIKEKYAVLNIKPGSYYLDSLHMRNGEKIKFDHKMINFSVENNEIFYIGDLSVNYCSEKVKKHFFKTKKSYFVSREDNFAKLDKFIKSNYSDINPLAIKTKLITIDDAIQEYRCKTQIKTKK